MAVVNTKSNAITNADATPVVKNHHALQGGMLQVAVGTVAVAAADDDTSVYRFVRIPSNAVVVKIELFNDAITAGTDYHFGLHQTAANGGAVANANAWGNSVDLSSARVAPLDITHEGGGDVPIENCEKKVWEIVPTTTDPGREYDITATANTVGSAAGDITLKVYYVV